MPYKRACTVAEDDENEDELNIRLATPSGWSDAFSSIDGSTERSASEGVAIVTPSPVRIMQEVRMQNVSDQQEYDVRPGRKRRMLDHIGQSLPGYPRSAYSGWESPLPRVSEREALHHLLAATYSEGGGDRDDFETIVLEDFSVYRPMLDPEKNTGRYKGRGQELVTLDQLLHNGCPHLLFDGILVRGSNRRYVQGVEFKTLVVDGYGTDEILDTKDRISIQTPLGKGSKVWYQLGTPSTIYARFDKPFRWVVQLTKFFIDYLLDGEGISLEHFRYHFHTSISSKYADTPTLAAWLAQCAMCDFRTAINANVEFLYKEWCGIHVDHSEDVLYKHPIWSEILTHRLEAIPQQEVIEQKTIVTPFAANCFNYMYFADMMESRPVANKSVRSQIRRLKRDLKLTPFNTSPSRQSSSLHTPDSMSEAGNDDASEVQVGDVVCYPAEVNGQWRPGSHNVWYAYVQDIRTKIQDGHQQTTLLDVLWLYQPQDTTMGNTYYPYSNELFMSDNCSCGQDALPLEDIVGTIKVSFFEQDPSVPGFFVRQKFGTVSENDEHYFETLKQTHFACECYKQHDAFDECCRKYRVSDTVLRRVWDPESEDNWLEPVQIIDFDLEKRAIRLRELRRAETDSPFAAANELLLTSRTFFASATSIIRSCHVLVVEETDNVPTPYDRGGTGDLFFIRHREISAARQLQVGTEQLPLPKQGWDPSEDDSTPLKGLGIFCGGGNLDRGLEEGGAVRFSHAVDYAAKALHSYRANCEESSEIQLFLGSVNDYLAQALAGRDTARQGGVQIARPGEIELLSAGSPCPGFSAMQSDKLSDLSRRNASMVASVISYVDVYCPKYLFLENVVEMTFLAGPNKDQNVFGQIIASLVALGYQVQQFLMDAWTLGSSQHRSRIFVVASAPDMKLLDTPPYTHAHPPDQRLSRNLGKGANGKAFGNRRNDDVPFRQVSVADTVNDLPNIGDSMPQICPQYPDHRVPSVPSAHYATRMAMIPILPEGSSLVKAGQRHNWLSGEPLKLLCGLNATRSVNKSSTLSRVVPSGLFSCVLTVLAIMDGRGGRTLHSSQHRSLTVMELKRAQGVLDHEVIIGNMPEQVKIIGNMVDRKVSLALGLSLRQSLQAPQLTTLTSEALPVITSSTQSATSQIASISTPRSSAEIDYVVVEEDMHQLDAVPYKGMLSPDLSFELTVHRTHRAHNQDIPQQAMYSQASTKARSIAFSRSTQSVESCQLFQRT